MDDTLKREQRGSQTQRITNCKCTVAVDDLLGLLREAGYDLPPTGQRQIDLQTQGSTVVLTWTEKVPRA